MSIGGKLGANGMALLARPETAHRPDDVETLRREVLRLASEGLIALDIGQALRLHPGEVAGLLCTESVSPADDDA